MTYPKPSLWLLLLLATPTFAASTDELLNRLEATEDPKAALQLIHELETSVPALSALDQGRFYARLGLVQEDELHDISSADTSFNHAIALLEPLHQPSQALADAYYERAYIKYLHTRDTKVYCPDREKAVSITRRFNHPDLLAKYLIALSFCYTDSPEQFQQGLAILDEAISLAEKHNLGPGRLGMIYNAASMLYRQNQFYDNAYDYSQRAYDQWASIDDRQSMEDMQHTLLVNAIDLGELDKAEEHGRQLFKLADTSPEYKSFRFFAYYDTGTIALFKRDLPRAIKLFEQARNEEKNTEEAVFVAMNRAQLATAYFMNGNIDPALKEAAAVIQLPGYTGFEPAMRQKIQTLLQFQKHNSAQAIRTLLDLLATERAERHQFLKKANRDAAVQHDNRIQQFETQLLQNKLQIQQLQLDAQQHQQEAARWYLALTTIATVSLAMLAYTLLRSRSRFRTQAQTDALTGIANRRHFFDFTHKLVKRARQHELLVSVMVLDIDHFKNINDTYGHQAGDAAIKHVAAHALACLRTNDVLSRTGGEEFAAILPETETDDAWKIAERIRMCIEQTPLNHGGDQIHITISVGLATGKLTTDDTESLLQMADHAMYRAKSAGRNRSQLAEAISGIDASNEAAVTADQLNVTIDS